MSTHHCRACLMFCIDYRFNDHLSAFLKEQRLIEDGVDVVRLAGSIRDLVRGDEAAQEMLLKQLTISHKLHDISEIHLINHEDCGAYGPENICDCDAELALHRQDLQAAKEKVQAQIPALKIACHFMRLDGSVETISA